MFGNHCHLIREDEIIFTSNILMINPESFNNLDIAINYITRINPDGAYHKQ